jgi:hypothetical protein
VRVASDAPGRGDNNEGPSSTTSGGPSPLNVALPSGRSVSIAILSDQLRPWQIQSEGAHCTIVRPWRGDSSRQETLREAGRREPLVLEPVDAEALLVALRSRVGRRVSAKTS